MTSVNPPTPARREPAHTPLAGTLSSDPFCPGCCAGLCRAERKRWRGTGRPAASDVTQAQQAAARLSGLSRGQLRPLTARQRSS